MGRLETILRVELAPPPAAPPPQAARAKLATTRTESTAKKRLDIFLLLQIILGEFNFPHRRETKNSGLCLLGQPHLLLVKIPSYTKKA
jgi:hypothetical protein